LDGSALKRFNRLFTINLGAYDIHGWEPSATGVSQSKGKYKVQLGEKSMIIS
jgi:hypothetical protein